MNRFSCLIVVLLRLANFEGGVLARFSNIHSNSDIGTPSCASPRISVPPLEIGVALELMPVTNSVDNK